MSLCTSVVLATPIPAVPAAPIEPAIIVVLKVSVAESVTAPPALSVAEFPI